MNRRRFLSTLGLAAAGLAFDPERLLWVPGRKKIFIPSQEWGQSVIFASNPPDGAELRKAVKVITESLRRMGVSRHSLTFHYGRVYVPYAGEKYTVGAVGWR